jgi:hypothetical protein
VSTSDADPVDRGAITAELNRCREDLHALLASATPAHLGKRSDGTAWTSEQLLFHMVFGFLIVARLLPLVRLMPRLPAPFGRRFAATLDGAHRPFHVVNYLGSCAAATVFNHARMGWLCDRTITGLVHHLASEPEVNLHRAMPFPARWDPYFQPSMTLAQVYAYPILHYDHHRRQLSLPEAQ